MACDWPVDRSCLPSLPELPDDPTDEQQVAYDLALAQRNSAEDLAVSVLWSLSGRQFGICETTVRPCPRPLPYGAPYMASYREPFILTLDNGHWLNWPCGCLGSCTVSGPRVVHLPGPVAEVVAVTIGGQTLHPDDYQLEGNALYRVGATWPRQDLSRPLNDPNTWSVTYTRGNPVPAGVDRLTGVLAKELLAACNGGKCRLPRTVTSTTRQGVTHSFESATARWTSYTRDSGKTGIPEIDVWLSAINPNRLTANPVVL